MREGWIQKPSIVGHYQPVSETSCFRWRADDGPTLNAGLVAFMTFQEIRTRITKKLYTFVTFQVGADPLSPLLGIRA